MASEKPSPMILDAVKASASKFKENKSALEARAKELEERYHALCENMEGAAAAQVAELHGAPWLEVRGISNIVEDRDLKKWDIPRAAQNVQQAVLQILEGWSG